jgi:hypothetical protein
MKFYTWSSKVNPTQDSFFTLLKAPYTMEMTNRYNTTKRGIKLECQWRKNKKKKELNMIYHKKKKKEKKVIETQDKFS